VSRTVRTEDSPAFQLVERALQSLDRYYAFRNDEILNSMRCKLHNIYLSRMASPTDIDENGYNIAHKIIQVNLACLFNTLSLTLTNITKNLYPNYFGEAGYSGNTLIALRSLQV